VRNRSAPQHSDSEEKREHLRRRGRPRGHRPEGDRFDEVLTPGALKLVALLHRELDGRRLELLTARQQRVRAPVEGGGVGFPAETPHVREGDSWQLFLEMAVSDEYRDSLTLPADERMP
jgi:malate synthase